MLYLCKYKKVVVYDGLSLKQKKFADEYIISGNATESYKKAYTKVKKESVASAGASRMLRNVNVKQYIDKQLKEIGQEKIATAEEILQYLSAVMRGEQTEQTLKNLGSELGQNIVDIEVSAKDRIKAAELLGKRYGMWTERKDVTVNVPTFIDDIPVED